MIYREHTIQHCKEAQVVIDSIPPGVIWRSLTLLTFIMAVIISGIVLSWPEKITIPFEARYCPATSTIMLHISTDKAMPLIRHNVRSAVLSSSALPERYIDTGVTVTISEIFHHSDQNVTVSAHMNMDPATTDTIGFQNISGNLTTVIPGKSLLQIMIEGRIRQ